MKSLSTLNGLYRYFPASMFLSPSLRPPPRASNPHFRLYMYSSIHSSTYRCTHITHYSPRNLCLVSCRCLHGSPKLFNSPPFIHPLYSLLHPRRQSQYPQKKKPETNERTDRCNETHISPSKFFFASNL